MPLKALQKSESESKAGSTSCPKKFPEALLRCYHQSNSGLPTSVKEVPTLEERGHVTQPWCPMYPLRPQASKGEASRTAGPVGAAS